MNHSRFIQFAGHAVKFNTVFSEILKAVDVHFAHCLGEEQGVICTYQVEAGRDAGFSIRKDGQLFLSDLTAEQVLVSLMQDALTVLTGESRTDLIFHSAALSHQGRGLLLCGKSGSGKSTLAACLTSKGCQYLTDEVVAYPSLGGEVRGFCRSLVLKRASAVIWQPWLAGAAPNEYLKMSDGSAWITPTLLNANALQSQILPQVILFPTYSEGALFETERLTPGVTLFMLLECLVNARNFSDLGMGPAGNLSRKISAYRFTYSNIEQASEWIQQTITA